MFKLPFKLVLPSLGVLLISWVLFLHREEKPLSKAELRKQYAEFLNNHPVNQQNSNSKLFRHLPSYQAPDEEWKNNFLKTMDPKLGRPAPERLKTVRDIAKIQSNKKGLIPGSVGAPWVERGPSEVGGRTRALMLDPNDPSKKKAWAGGVTGGLWYTNDITNPDSSWYNVDDFWDNISITCIACDPNNTNIFYIGTGEGWGTGSSRGNGIYKSTDGGASWFVLTYTEDRFYYVNDLMVRDNGGSSEIYAAVAAYFYNGSWQGLSDQGLQRSTNGGTSFSQVLPPAPFGVDNYTPADIEISAGGRIFVGTKQAPPYVLTGRGGGTILYSDAGSIGTWTIITTFQDDDADRVELACAPSNSNVLYAVIEKFGLADTFAISTNGGNTWRGKTEPIDVDNGIPDDDFTRGQAWYDLILAVDPNDAKKVYVGGIDLFSSADSGGSWSHISKWSNNNNLAALNCSEVHADQHALVFHNGSSDSLLVGNDGGIYYTTNLSNAVTSDVFIKRNKDYNVTQFYACAIDPTAGENSFLAGAQDNGTHFFDSPGIDSTDEISGGDGAFCFIDQTNDNYAIVSYVYNTYYLFNGTSWSTLVDDQNTGEFINIADYDDNQHALYTSKCTSGDKALYKFTNLTTTPTQGTINLNSNINSDVSAIKISPYTTASSTIFVGTEVGELIKITGANGGSPSITNIDPKDSLSIGNISCIEVGANENELLVTFTNYGVTSVWYTSDGGNNWVSKEGDLPDMPVRWALFNPTDSNEVILATELGVWSTTNLSASSPAWVASNSGLANVRVDMLQVRTSDNEAIAATHGRGLFSSNAFDLDASEPAADFSVDKDTVCSGETIYFTDLSTNTPTSWKWYNNGVLFSSAQNPSLLAIPAGTLTIKLIAENASGKDSVEMNVEVLQTVSTAIAGSDSTIYDQDSLVLYGNSPIVGNGKWTIVSGTASFDYDTAATAVVRGLSYGTNKLIWTVENAACSSSDTVVITRISTIPPLASFSVSQDTVCLGDIVSFTDLSINGPTIWNWSFGDGNSSSSQNTSHEFTTIQKFYIQLVVENMAGKDSITDSIVVINYPEANAGLDQDLSINSVSLGANLNSGESGVWTSLNSGPLITNTTSPSTTVTNLPEGTNSFIWTVSNGYCSDADTLVISVSTSYEEYLNHETILYPNPSSGIFYVEFPQKIESRLEVVDIRGKCVYTQTINSKITTIDMTNHNKGLYLLIIKAGSSSINRNIILDK